MIRSALRLLAPTLLVLLSSAHAAQNADLQNAFPQVGQTLIDWDKAWTNAPDLATRIELTNKTAASIEAAHGKDSPAAKIAAPFLAQRIRHFITPTEFFKATSATKDPNFLPNGLEEADHAILKSVAQDTIKKYQDKNYTPPERSWTTYQYRANEPLKTKVMDSDALRTRVFQGHIGAIYDLAHAYANGDDTPVDQDSCYFWFQQSKRLGLPVNAVPEEAAAKEAYYRRFADAGSLRFTAWLLDILIPKVENKALENYEIGHRLKILAENNYTPYFDTIGGANRTAYYGLHDLHEAKRVLEYGAAQDRSYSLVELAIVEIMLLHLEGHLDWPPARAARVFSLLENASKAGSNYATLLLGQLHELGIGTPADEAKARSYYQKAIADGYELAGGDIARLDQAEGASATYFTNSIPNAKRYLALTPETAKNLNKLTAIECVDLRYLFQNGTGFRKDAFLQDYFINRVIASGFQYPEWSGNSATERLQFWAQLAQQGSVFSLAEAGLQAAILGDDSLAASYFSKAALHGSPYATVRYAELELAGNGAKINRDAAIARLKTLAPTDSYAAETLAAVQASTWQMPTYKPTVVTKKRLPPEYDIAQRLAVAETGDRGAIYDLVYAYFNARGVDYNKAQVDQWEQRLKDTGFIIPAWGKSKAENHTFWKTLAETGSLAASWEFTSDLLDGDGVEKDHATAIPLLRSLAAKGNFKAQFYLGKALRLGWWGIEKDLDQAMEWLEKALVRADDQTQFELASAYFNASKPAPQSNVEGLQLFKLSAAQGNRLATMMVVDSLLRGNRTGIKKDPNRGAAWLLHFAGLPPLLATPFDAVKQIETAALSGNPQAMEAYAYALVSGVDIPDNDLEGLAWFKAMETDPILKAKLTTYVAYSWYKSFTPTLAEAEEAAFEQKVQERASQIAQALKATPFVLPGFTPAVFKIPEEIPAQTNAAIDLVKKLMAKDWTGANALLAQTSLTLNPLYPIQLGSLLENAPNTPNQHWLADLAQITAPSPDAAAAENALTPFLIGSAPAGTAEFNKQQALRRLVALRLYYGVDRPSDRPAAAAWLLLHAGGDKNNHAYQYAIAKLAPEQLAATQSLYQRIVSYLKGPLPNQIAPLNVVNELQKP